MTEDSLTIRTATSAEVEFMIELAAREGWNPGLHDADCFRAVDPEGFLVCVSGERLIGCIAAASYGGEFGFIGLYVVVPEARGSFCGVRLARAAMARLAGRTVGIDGVFERQAQYAHLGFRFAYRNIRFELRERAVAAPAGTIAHTDAVAFADLLTYDRGCFPAEREPFLRCWLGSEDHHSRVLLRDGRLAGYGTIRRCRSGWKVGPLFADDAVGAHALLGALCGVTNPDEPIFVDVPEANGEAMALAARLGMREVFGTARMYMGPAPAIALERVFGVTSFELG